MILWNIKVPNSHLIEYAIWFVTGEFRGTDFPGESILAMSCDSESTTLVTGDTQGFIYTWNIEDYCLKPEAEVGEIRLWDMYHTYL